MLIVTWIKNVRPIQGTEEFSPLLNKDAVLDSLTDLVLKVGQRLPHSSCSPNSLHIQTKSKDPPSSPAAYPPQGTWAQSYKMFPCLAFNITVSLRLYAWLASPNSGITPTISPLLRTCFGHFSEPVMSPVYWRYVHWITAYHWDCALDCVTQLKMFDLITLLQDCVGYT